MPDFSDYPQMADVRNLLMSSAFWPTNASKQVLAEEQAAIGAAAVKSEWERRTGWKPFLAGDSDTTWYFDNTDEYGELQLNGGFVSITSVTVSGTLQTLNTHYTTEPRNAIAEGVPITRIDFPYGGWRTGYPTTPNSIAVVGRRGFCTSIPPDVWQTLQSAAALIALIGVENLQSIASIGVDGFNKAFDVVGILTQKDIADKWGKNFDQKVGQYVRVIC